MQKSKSVLGLKLKLPLQERVSNKENINSGQTGAVQSPRIMSSRNRRELINVKKKKKNFKSKIRKLTDQRKQLEARKKKGEKTLKLNLSSSISLNSKPTLAVLNEI